MSAGMKHPRFGLLALPLLAGLCFAPAQAAPDQPPELPAARLSHAGTGLSDTLLKGNATIERTVWQKHFDAGMKALERRLYGVAERKLQQALSELRRTGASDSRLLSTKIALAEAYLGRGRVSDAEQLFADCALKTRVGGNVHEKLSALSGLASTYLAQDKHKKAELTAREAIAAAHDANLAKHHRVGKAHHTLACALERQGLEEDALANYQKAVAILEAAEGMAKCDLADALIGLAIAQQTLDHNANTEDLFKRAFELKDSAVQLNQSSTHVGLVRYHWQQGCPRSRQVYDPDYPLKYMTVNGVRVAATIVRSENVIGAVVSLANCGKERIEIGVGPVLMDQLAPKRKPFMHVSPHVLDMALEEEHISDLTWRRRWLNHIQKTRRIPGYLKGGELDQDNFFGNNIFGPYGSWQSLARPATPIVTREQFLYSPHFAPKQTDNADFLAGTTIDLHPTVIDAGDARTGLVFFLRERFDKAQLRVVIGNAEVVIPFNSAGPR